MNTIGKQISQAALDFRPKSEEARAWGARLFHARTVQKLSQRDLGEVLNLNSGMISKWENGVALPNLQQLEMLIGLAIKTIKSHKVNSELTAALMHLNEAITWIRHGRTNSN